MAWIKSFQELGRHPKTRRLARSLGISMPEAVGHLNYLWWWTLDFAKDGILSRYTVEDIADGGEWEGDPAKFVDALIDAGFLDCDEEGMSIHDWAEYGGKLVKEREDNYNRVKRSRAKDKEQDDTSDTGECNEDDTEMIRESSDNDTPMIRRKIKIKSKIKSKIKNTQKETTQRKTAPRFTPPTLDEVRAYCEERGNGIDAEQFVDHYNANGWKVGRSPMKDWKAAIRNWEKNEYRRREPGKEYGPNGIELAPYDPEDPLNGLF